MWRVSRVSGGVNGRFEGRVEESCKFDASIVSSALIALYPLISYPSE